MLTKDEVLEQLNVSPSTLNSLVRDKMILKLTVGEQELYPSEQFTGGGLNARVASFLGVFRNLNLSSEEIWSWINTPLMELEFATPLELSREYDDPEVVDRLRFVVAAQLSFKAMENPALEREKWSTQTHSNVDPNGVGDYIPHRRGEKA